MVIVWLSFLRYEAPSTFVVSICHLCPLHYSLTKITKTLGHTLILIHCHYSIGPIFSHLLVVDTASTLILKCIYPHRIPQSNWIEVDDNSDNIKKKNTKGVWHSLTSWNEHEGDIKSKRWWCLAIGECERDIHEIIVNMNMKK